MLENFLKNCFTFFYLKMLILFRKYYLENNINKIIFSVKGVFANTGEIKYKCVSGVSECKNNTDSQEYVEEDILIIQRFQQTVRAIEDRAGSER